MYLAIDTITSAAGITVFNQNTSVHISLNPQHASEGIIDAIDQAFKKTKITPSNLKAVFVIKGPGSFTGLRVGISVANQFSHQLKIPIVGLRTDEFWKIGLKSSAIYLQSMNRDEVYLSEENGYSIIPIGDLAQLGSRSFVGELKFDHAEKIPGNLTKLQDLEYIGTQWPKAIEVFENQLKAKKIYDLVEPFYGKEAKITPAKKK